MTKGFTKVITRTNGSVLEIPTEAADILIEAGIYEKAPSDAEPGPSTELVGEVITPEQPKKRRKP